MNKTVALLTGVAAVSLVVAVAAIVMRNPGRPSAVVPPVGLASPSPSVTPEATASATAASPTATPTAPANATVSRCATSQLRLSLGGTQGATGNEIASVTMVNGSTSTCYLGGYPGVELLDRNGRHLANAQWSTDSFFGTYAPTHRVEIPPGGQTTFDLTWGGIDPCGNVPAQYPASLKITPPGDYDSQTIPASPPGYTMTVCPNTMVAHPVGSKPKS